MRAEDEPGRERVVRIHIEVGPLNLAAVAYKTADTPPRFGWNRYSDRTIGAYFRTSPKRVFSLVWRNP